MRYKRKNHQPATLLCRLVVPKIRKKRKKAQGNNHIDKNICAFFLVPVVPS